MKTTPDIRVWSHEPLPARVQASLRRVASLEDVIVTAAMPDVHLAKGVCVGAVIATSSRLFPGAVGGDIGCGMCAVQLDVSADLVSDKKTAASILRMLEQSVPTAQHRSRDTTLPPPLAEGRLSAAAWDTYLDCHHNFVRRETHDGIEMWVHRKGAISARDGEPGVIPGSMGSASYHVAGRGNAESLCSSSHGAGRVMSRSAARRAVSTDALFRRMEGILFDHRLSNRLRDEAPQAYKDISAVMRSQRTLTRIVRRLRPILVFKGA